jgi:hypothetical protein
MMLCKFFLNAVDIMDEVDESSRPIGETKRHDHIGSFYGINSLKNQLLLTSKSNGKLVITHRRIERPAPLPFTKLVVNSRIAPRNWVCN